MSGKELIENIKKRKKEKIKKQRRDQEATSAKGNHETTYIFLFIFQCVLLRSCYLFIWFWVSSYPSLLVITILVSLIFFKILLIAVYIIDWLSSNSTILHVVFLSMVPKLKDLEVLSVQTKDLKKKEVFAARKIELWLLFPLLLLNDLDVQAFLRRNLCRRRNYSNQEDRILVTPFRSLGIFWLKSNLNGFVTGLLCFWFCWVGW